MKLLHLSDLHIGKKLNDFDLIEEQKYVLNQAIELAAREKIEIVLIAGDVFDRAIPSYSALNLFDYFLDELSKLNCSIYIISGNHDSVERLSFLSTFLKKSNIFISHEFDGCVEFYDNKNIRIYMLPYLFPAQIRKYYPDIEISNFNDAIKSIINDIKLDKKKINILLTHQFVTGSVVSDSEEKQVALLGNIDFKIFNKFDYVALGHLHCPQDIKKDKIRYGGSILKYSFSEINQKKSFTILDISDDIKIKTKEIKFLRELKEYTGFIDEFLDEKFYSKINREDYIHFILKDEMVLDAKKKLSVIYPNIVSLEFDNEITKNLNNANLANFQKDKTIIGHFCDFYKMQTGLELSMDDIDLIKKEIL